MSFDSLGLQASLLQAVQDTGYTIPTPIQLQAIPAILSGRDVMAAAQTGTGKTAGFTLPLLQRLGGKEPVPHNKVRALILSPTRELAAQIQESIETYGKHEKLRSVVVFGGVNINPQMQALRKGCDLLVATPGRLLDLYQQNAVRFDALEVLVLDEADRMLDMGFIRDIRKILAMLPKQRQNLLFSATFSDEIRTLAKTICRDPLEIDVAPRNSTVDTISQRIYRANKEHKLPLLAKLLQETPDQVLVFSRTKHGANNLVKKLTQYDIKSAAIHGNKSQSQRTKALADFKNGQVQVLIATDIAARGIDIEQLSLVINHDMPQVPEDYVHRIGRTGRAGASGAAVSLVSDEETGQLRAIERLIKRKIDVAQFDVASLPVRNPAIAEVADDEREDSRQGRPQQRRQQQPRQGQGQGQGRPRTAQGSQGQSSNRQRSATQGSSAQGQPRSNSNNSYSTTSYSTTSYSTGSPSSHGASNNSARNGSASNKPRGPRDGQRGQQGQGRSGGSQGRPQQGSARPQSNGNKNGNRIDGNRQAALSGKSQHGSAPQQPAGTGPSFWQRLRDSLPGM